MIDGMIPTKPANKPPVDPEEPVFTDNVPVRQPVPEQGPGIGANPSDTATNPIAGAAPNNQPASEEEMDRVLEDVNQKVKSAPEPEKPGFFSRRKKAPPVHPPVETSHPKGRSLAAVAVAVIVSLGLVGAAYFSFAAENKTDQPPTATQTPEPVNSSVKASDIDNLSNEIQTEADSLDGNQDFDPAALSDSSLGL